MKNANRLCVSPRKPVLNTSISRQMSNQTPELKNADTARFVVRSFCVALVFLIMLFGYSIVFTEQPLFNEAPADKQIFGVLILVVGQILTILANYLSRTTGSAATSTPPTPINPCQSQLGYQPLSPIMNQYSSPMGIQPMANNFTTAQNNYPIPDNVGMAWTPPAGPTNPPHHLEPDEERAAIAAARQSVKGQ